ncbi:MAG: class I SAM-dependent RNA methyltransferase [Rhizobiaceae bacterium]
MIETLRIDRLGAQGDGIAETPGGPVYVPFTLPGETVELDRSGGRTRPVSILEASTDRVPPPCRHFGDCGGCSLQHMEAAAYLAFKRERVVEALRSRGIDTPVEPTVACRPATRRRVVLSARRVESAMVLGFNRAMSHDVVDLLECRVAKPAIEAALPLLRDLVAAVGLGAKDAHVAVVVSDAGMDIAVTQAGRIREEARLAASRIATAKKVARLSVNGEVLLESARPTVRFGRAVVTPPPGGFMQAVEDAESVIAELVTAHLAPAKRVADLFSGSGAFALRLAEKAELHAVESDSAALAALDRGFRESVGLRRVTTERRDLFRRPLTTTELGRFDGLVFDPPRAGAEAQATQIARSDVPLVAAVSCNPATLGRDLRTLLDGGYRIERVTPVDQFLWSAHVEAVALLSKPKRRR